MDPYPKPARGRGRGRDRGGSGFRVRKGTRDHASSAGKQSSSRTILRNKRGPSSESRPSKDELWDNSTRYEEDRSVSDESDRDGLDFETEAGSTMQIVADSKDLISSADSLPLGDFTADFSGLEAVLASVPLWIRLGGSEHVRRVLGCDSEDDAKYLLDEKKSAERNPDGRVLEKGPATALLDEFTSLEIHQQGDNGHVAESDIQLQTEDRAKVAVADKTASDDDDFDAWLENA